MNQESFDLPSIELSLPHLSPVVSLLLHSILFFRSLGTASPEEFSPSPFPSIVAVRVDEENQKTRVESVSKKLQAALEKGISSASPEGPPALIKLELVISFYEKAVKKTWLGAVKEDRVVWEKWSLPFLLTVPSKDFLSDSHKFGSARQLRSVEGALQAIINQVNKKKDHVPPVKSNTLVEGFHYEVTFTYSILQNPGGGGEAIAGSRADEAKAADEAWGLSTIKRMLKQGPPMLIKS